MRDTKLIIVAAFLFIVQILFAQYKGQHYSIRINNNCPFDLKAEGLVEKGQGIFHPYTSIIKKGQSFEYNCENDNAFKGVEGHLLFTASGGEVYGNVDFYFNNPAVGTASFAIDSKGSFAVAHIVPPASKRDPNLWVSITIDSSGRKDINPLPVSGGTGKERDLTELIPPVINFDWEVIQRMRKDENDENDGKAYREVRYFFTTNGDYAAMKPDDKSFSLMVYSKNGNTWLFDEEKKIITVMSMPKTVFEGGLLGKALADHINHAPISKDKEEEFILTKTGKTKSVFNYTAEEFSVLPAHQISSNKKSDPFILWYATVPFDPIKIYTIGAGRPPDITALQNNPAMKNNMFAIPLLHKNYLWVEAGAGGIKGLETLAIKQVNNTIYTAGYKVKMIRQLKDMIQKDDKDN